MRAGYREKIVGAAGRSSRRSQPGQRATTVHYDETKVTLADMERVVDECGLTCHGESLPLHHGGHAVHSRTAVEKHDHAAMEHAGHEMDQDAGGAAHGGRAGMTMDDMARDMRNRFLASLLLTIPVFLYLPLFTRFFNIQLPRPFGLSEAVIGFILTTPIVLYGARPFGSARQSSSDGSGEYRPEWIGGTRG